MNEIRSVSVMVDIARSYLFAKQQLLAMGFGHEIVESYDSKLADLTETTLLQETAWVILSAGMAERTVRGKFTDITASFLGWCSAREIAANATICYSSALLHFNHPGKIGAIAKMAAVIDSETFPSVREAIIANPLTALARFPFIGPVTVFHLAKNLGVSVAKPDRHLQRLAVRYGFEDAHELCASVSGFVGDPVCVVDTVLWRYATITGTRQVPVAVGA